ncbi:MAG: RagB/SusD family nutrient uptake outer membrane protein [Gemmatimonadota bacterium]
MKHDGRSAFARQTQRRAIAAFAMIAALAGAACSSLLDVDAPSRVRADNLNNPVYAQLLVKSAVGDFDCAFASYIVTTGQVVDEFKAVNISSAEASDYDRRSVSPARTQYASNGCGGLGAIYQPISTAIWQADNVLELLSKWTDTEVPDRARLSQTAQAYAGYGRIFLGEGFCSAAISGGPELQPAAIFKQADSLFTVALGGSDTQISTLARLGRARARLDMGNTAGALSDALLVPAGFVQYARYSDASNRSRNVVFNTNNFAENVSIDVQNQDVAFGGVPDPRVAVLKTRDRASNGIDTVWVQLKYASLNASIPLARYAEAQLIVAEVSGGQTAVDIINQLHTAAGLPQFSSTDPVLIRDHVIQERARELFLEGQRFFDFNRFTLPFNPPAGAPYWQGGTYGTTRCFPLPDLERDNNANIQ